MYLTLRRTVCPRWGPVEFRKRQQLHVVKGVFLYADIFETILSSTTLAAKLKTFINKHKQKTNSGIIQYISHLFANAFNNIRA